MTTAATATTTAKSTAPTASTVPSPTTTKTPTSYWIAHVMCAIISTIIIRSFWEFNNASEALAFYGVYHRYPWNQVIHFFGVPGILWSFFMFMVHIPFPISIGVHFGRRGRSGTIDGRSPTIDYASVMAIAYELFYLRIDPYGGTLYAPVLWAMYWSSVKIWQRDQQAAAETITKQSDSSSSSSSSSTSPPWYGTGKLLKFAAFIHVLSWYLQIHLGHHVIEGATPAVLQSFGGALSVAPLFAFYEGLWLVGINSELQNTTLQLVDEYTQELCSSGDVMMKVCETLN